MSRSNPERGPGAVPFSCYFIFCSAARAFANCAPCSVVTVDAGHNVLNGAVLAGRIHGLQNDQQRVSLGGEKKVLIRGQTLLVVLELG